MSQVPRRLRAFWIATRRARKRPHRRDATGQVERVCASCGYPRRGWSSNYCPECGAFSRRGVTVRPSWFWWAFASLHAFSLVMGISFLWLLYRHGQRVLGPLNTALLTDTIDWLAQRGLLVTTALFGPSVLWSVLFGIIFGLFWPSFSWRISTKQ